MTAIANNWGAYYRTRVQAVLDGNWETGDTWWGMKEDVIQMTPYNDVIPGDVQKAADEVAAGIAAGTWDPFAGPIKDQSGADRVAAGEALGDGDLHTMDWYVEGVQS